MRTRISKPVNHRKLARDAAAELLAGIGDVVRGSPRAALPPDGMPNIVVRIVADEADGEETLRGAAAVVLELAVTVVSAKGEDEIDDLLTRADETLFANPTLNGAVESLAYDSFTLDDPELDGEKPVFSGTATYLARATR